MMLEHSHSLLWREGGREREGEGGSGREGGREGERERENK